MENRTYSARFLQERKFYMALPLLALPFLTFFYWATVVKNVKKTGTTALGAPGLNTSLPDAFLKEGKPMDKLSYYQKAAEDSAKRADLIKKDPYRRNETISENENPAMTLQGLEGPYGKKKRVAPVSYKGKTYQEPNEARVYGKLKELDAILAKSAGPQFADGQASPQSAGSQTPAGAPAPPAAAEASIRPDMERLESLVASLHAEGQAEIDQQDPEMKELNELLDKVMDIQHPERVADRLQDRSRKNQGQVFAVSQPPADGPVTTLESSTDSLADDQVSQLPFQQNGFFSLDQQVTASAQNAISAVVHEDQQLVTGSTLKLRLTNDIYVGDVLVPKDSFVFGSAQLNGERLMVQITSIRCQNSLLAVKLSVYDLDGIPGIYIPDAISRNVAKQSLGQDLQGLSIPAIDPSLGAEVASAGIQTAKTFLGRKTRLVQVSVKAGYQVLLRDGNAATM